jgi:hypothetical protein
MCVSCGCGKPNDTHGDSRHITLQDIDAAAQAAGTTREKIAQNIVEGVRAGSQEERATGMRQDGYLETEGSGYGASQSRVGEPASANPAQQGYDPAHSGVQPARNQPGRRSEIPGREEGTAYGENRQMGYTTDTPDRRNPADR